ncbi:hypothetical protein [uncultured Chryseobacterium sp.]|uniref:hypothetical protein n=1 Tax=uncultured Chryseobacterium sp. TaxID=259322 RepID=UPI0025E7FF1F|nr:hypothetical protein [uncultured Chryseobacterium sp.]
MKNRILILLVLITHLLFAQSKKRIVEELHLPDPTQVISGCSYNGIKLQDIRTNPGDFGIVKKGLSDRKAEIAFSPGFEQQLSEMFKKGIDPSSVKDQELLLQLRAMNYMETTINMVQYGYFTFRGLLFGGRENQYQLIKKMDTTLVVFNVDVTKELEKRSLDYIRKAVFEAAVEKPVSQRMYTADDINNYDKIAKSALPLYTHPKLTDGIYRSYHAFSRQVPDQPISEIQVDLGMITKASYVDQNGKKKNAKEDSYAIVNQGKAYVFCDGELYPMRRMAEDFYFIAKTDPSPKPERQLRSAMTGIVFGGIAGGAVGYFFPKNKRKSYECKLDYFNGKYEMVREIESLK